MALFGVFLFIFRRRISHIRWRLNVEIFRNNHEKTARELELEQQLREKYKFIEEKLQEQKSQK